MRRLVAMPEKEAGTMPQASSGLLRGLCRRPGRKPFASSLAGMPRAGLEAQALVGLTAFHALGLLTFTPAPFHYTLREPVKCSLADSPLLGALRALTA